MEKYTGREIAIFTDIHGLLEPAKAILDDINKRGITEIYSLGDNIGLGPNPSEVLDLLFKNNVKSINGNSEDYVVLGIEPFVSYFNVAKVLNNEWTKIQLSPKQLENLEKSKHSYDLEVGGKKIGLCHFANDVRIDFGKNNTWSYQKSINYGLDNPQEQFYYTNSDDQTKKINEFGSSEKPIYGGFNSAKKDRIFDGKKVDYYDEIIQGHVHFKMLSSDEKVKIRTIRAAALAYGEDESIDYASYIIIKEKEKGYDVEEVLVPFDRNKMIDSIINSDIPDKNSIIKFTSRR